MQVLIALCERYPARVAAIVAAVVVFATTKFGVIVDKQSVTDAVVLVLPILLAGQLTHRAVVPVHKLTADPAVLPPDPVNRPPGEVSS